MALAAFCHPVLIPYAEKIIEESCLLKGIYGDLKFYESITSIVESINILCLIQGFSLDVLNLKSEP